MTSIYCEDPDGNLIAVATYSADPCQSLPRVSRNVHSRSNETCSSVSGRPFQCHSDVARQPTREVDVANAYFVPAGPEVPLPELVHLSRQAGQRVLPTWPEAVVDGAPAVGAQRVWETQHFHLGEPVLHRLIDDGGRSPERLVIRKARRFG